MCIDCHIDSNLPTQVQDRPWVGAFSLHRAKRRGIKKDEIDERLASAIASMTAEISEDKTTIILDVDEKAVLIPVNVCETRMP